MILKFNVDGIEPNSPFLSFFQTQDDGHYLLIMRADSYPENIDRDMPDVYFEFDDQSWGEYGGIEQIKLTRNLFVLKLDPCRTKRSIEYDEFHINFDCNDSDFLNSCNVLKDDIMEGYEDRLKITLGL